MFGCVHACVELNTALTAGLKRVLSDLSLGDFKLCCLKMSYFRVYVLILA